VSDAAQARPWRISRRLLLDRPRLAGAIGLGAVAAGVAAWLGAPPSAIFIAGWDVLCLSYLAMLAPLLAETPATIRRHAARQDEGQAVILVLVLTACVASLASAAIELGDAKDAHGWAKAIRVAAAVGTVAASWLVTQTTLALHYAHAYYGKDLKTGGDSMGLRFPGGGEPDYGDFLHFSMVIGAAAQTADIAFTDRRLRRIGTAHSLIAFVFNTLIVALTISLLAGLV
jgi:uncharacterized membrane protein